MTLPLPSPIIDGVHADSITQECATRPATSGIDRQDGDREILEVVSEAPNEFIGQRRLPSSARSCDPDSRRGPLAGARLRTDRRF